MEEDMMKKEEGALTMCWFGSYQPLLGISLGDSKVHSAKDIFAYPHCLSLARVRDADLFDRLELLLPGTAC